MNRRTLFAYLVALPFAARIPAHAGKGAARNLAEELDIDGLVSAYDRTYEVDSASLVADPPADMAQVYRMVTIRGMTFDSTPAATNYLEDTKTQVMDAMDVENKELAETVADLDVADHHGFLYTSNFPTYMDDVVMALAVIVFADGAQAFLVYVRDADIDTSTDLATDIATFIAEADIESDEVALKDDGSSTGGVFDRMPAAGDDLVRDLPMVSDTALMEAGE